LEGRAREGRGEGRVREAMGRKGKGEGRVASRLLGGWTPLDVKKQNSFALI